MAAAVLRTSGPTISDPFSMTTLHQRTAAKSHKPAASTSRIVLPEPTHSPPPHDAQPSTRNFGRLRSSLEQTMRLATRSKDKQPLEEGRPESKVKEKEKKGKVDGTTREKEKSAPLLRRLESKVGFRRSITPLPPPASSGTSGNAVRDAGFVPFQSPTLRGASMSSPTLHQYSQPSTPAKAVSPTPKDRTRRASIQPGISNPVALTSKRDAKSPNSKEPPREHKSSKSRPSPLLSTTPATSPFSKDSSATSRAETPLHRTRPATPETPTPKYKGRLGYSTRRIGGSTTNLPLETSGATSPTTSRGVSPSPISSRPLTSRTRTSSISHRNQASSSASHLPLPPHSPSSLTQRRPSVDSPRRVSLDAPTSPRRPSFEQPRRVSVDAPSPSPRRSSLDRSGSPSVSVRPRAHSPGFGAYNQNRHFNLSTSSLLPPPANPEHREALRSATSTLIKEFVKPPAHLVRAGDEGMREWQEIDHRLRPLIRLERIWGKSGAVPSSPTTSSSRDPTTGSSSSGLSAAGEERERKTFADALKDGYVLCQLMNKLRPNTIPRINHREDGFIHTSNITKFVAACTLYGLPKPDIMEGDDLKEATSESLARVGRNVTILVKTAEERSSGHRPKVMFGQGTKGGSSTDTRNPYGSSHAAASTPNLSQAQRSISPFGPPTPTSRKRWSPDTQGLPPVRSSSPGEGVSDSSSGTQTVRDGTPDSTVEDERLRAKVTPRSPLRIRKQSTSGTPPPNDATLRQSVASTSFTDSSAYSNLGLNDARPGGSGGNSNKFGTVRTMTTEATSLDAPSLTRSEANNIASSLKEETSRRSSLEAPKSPLRERRLSESVPLELAPVAEQNEDTYNSLLTRNRPQPVPSRKSKEEEERAARQLRIKLGQGKWPDDFLDVFEGGSPKRSSPLQAPSGLSTSPPRKLAIVGRRNESVEDLPLLPRRPTHLPRHSIDVPGLVGRDDPHNPDVRPARIVPRRSSSRGPNRPNMVPRSSLDEERPLQESSRPVPVPFPRAVSGESNGPYSGSPSRSSGSDEAERNGQTATQSALRGPRGRFQSEIEGASAKHRARPNSYDDLAPGNAVRRTRFESMVNLGSGIGSSNASASDLMSRDSLDGSAVRRTVIVREEGRPPTHYQLGNCIGRGQFGSVYRALNLNTGQMVAVKRIRLEGLKEDEVAQLMKEVDLVKSLSHPSIVKYEGMARDEDTLNIVLEYAENGSLGQTLKAFGKLNEKLVASYVAKILEGLHYLHTSDVVHCDLKAANILTTKTGNVKLSDFGVSLNMRAMEREIKDVAGTPNWMAPEVIELKGASPKSDIWSLGCTIVELLTGRPPYAEIQNSMTVMFRIVEDDRPPLPEECSELLQRFLQQCFQKDPSKRPSADTLFEHPWLQGSWANLKDLRPQDSIPFLRRFSAEMQKSEALRFLSQVDMPMSESPKGDNSPRFEDPISSSPGKVGIRRMSNTATTPKSNGDNDAMSPRDHTFVKTTFSKAMTCKVCLEPVKKSAVLCEQCSLIAHSKCAAHAPPTCDLRAQLLMYAQYAENGGASPSPFAHPMDILNAGIIPPTSPTSDGSFSLATPRGSVDQPRPAHTPTPGPQLYPPTSYKFMHAFRRSKSSLAPEPAVASPSSLPSDAGNAGKGREGKQLNRKTSVLVKRPRERPVSISSESTTPNTSSMRSTNESGSNPAALADRSAGRYAASRTRLPASDADRSRHSQATDLSAVSTSSMTISEAPSENGIPGDMPPDRRRSKKSTSSSNCTVQ